MAGLLKGGERVEFEGDWSWFLLKSDMRTGDFELLFDFELRGLGRESIGGLFERRVSVKGDVDFTRGLIRGLPDGSSNFGPVLRAACAIMFEIIPPGFDEGAFA